MLTKTIAVGGVVATAMLLTTGTASADGWGTVDCGQAQTPQCQLEVGETSSPPTPSSQKQTDQRPNASAPTRDQPDCTTPSEANGSSGAAAPLRPPGSWRGGTCSATGVIRNPAEGDTVSPEAVARQARAQLELPTPAVAASPAGVQLVNLPTWLWLTDGWEAIAATATVPGVSVTATANPRAVTWSTGDGAEVVCAGPGTPFPAGAQPRSSSPDCGHTYRRASTDQPSEAYPVVVTVHWSVTWSGAGSSGTFPDLTTTASTSFRVAESQALNVPGPR